MSEVGILDDKIQDNAAMIGVSDFFCYCLHSLCEITYSNISLKIKRGYPTVFMLLNRCWPLDRVLMHENGDKAPRLGLNFQIVQGTDGRWEAQNVIER